MAAAVEPPEWASPEARTIWASLAPHVTPGSLTTATAPSFAMLCATLATYIEAAGMVDAAGALIAEANSTDLVINPALPIRVQADAMYSRAAQEFGLTPATQPDPDQGAGAARRPRRTVEG